jgi:hypothetical protein
MTCINAEGYYLTQDGYYQILNENGNEVQILNDARELSWYPKRIFA